MSKICFLIPDGVGIRNYLYSDLIRQLYESGHEVVIWHALASQVVDLSAKVSGYLPQQKPFKGFKDDLTVQILRESSTYARLVHNVGITKNPTIMLNWHEKKGPLKRRALIRLAEFLGKRIKGYEGILNTEKIYFSRLSKTPAYKQYLSDLKDMNPDVILCTHQRFPGAAFAMEAAKTLKIPTVASIFSWDNLPKARLPLRTDFYSVWSEHMKSELQFYYPEIEGNQISITGTPQFDFYKNKGSIQTREDFAQEHGLDPKKKWVCFSGCDIKTSPFDSAYLRDVVNALYEEDDVQLLFRQVPVESADRYADVLKDFSKIVHLPPKWNKGKHWNEFYPLPEDIHHLVNLSYHCATVVNIGSTMALDFSWFDSPGLYLNYDHTADQEWTVRDIYNFQHFKSMGNWDAIVWANGTKEIKEKVRAILDHPDQMAKDRKKWMNRIIGAESQNQSAASNLAKLLVDVANKESIQV